MAASRQAGGVAVANLAIAKKVRTNADLENILRAVDRLKFVIRLKLQVEEGNRIVIGVVWTWSNSGGKLSVKSDRERRSRLQVKKRCVQSFRNTIRWRSEGREPDDVGLGDAVLPSPSVLQGYHERVRRPPC